MPQHIRELFTCAGAKFESSSEKSGRNNEENGYKRPTGAYVLLFCGQKNSFSRLQDMVFIEERPINTFIPKFVL